MMKHKANISVYLLVAVFMNLLIAGSLSAQRDTEYAQNVLPELDQPEIEHPRQKVFLHTDKEEYIAGEHVWIKAYNVNAISHEPDLRSTNLYVELFNSKGKVASMIMLRLENGIAHGDIVLPDSLPGGSYRLRAYTDWMNHFDESLFFKKDLYIYNPIEKNFIKRWDAWRNRLFNYRLQREKDNMQFAFFPESGHLLSNVENNVAFKAADKHGRGVKASGRLYDKNDQKILTFQTFHNGMGSFRFMPEAGNRYHAAITYENGDTKNIRLPVIQTYGYILSVEQSDDYVTVAVNGQPSPSSHHGNRGVTLFAHSRGVAVHKETIDPSGDDHLIRITRDSWQEGVGQIMLFHAEGKPLAERLVFINKGEILQSEVHTQKVMKNGQAFAEISIVPEAAPGQSHYSVSVVDTGSETTDYRSNIATSLLLFGEIDYTVEDPWYYLQPESEHAALAADLVMMTHAWRRFDWEQPADDVHPEIQHYFPEGITFSGQVLPVSSGRKTGEIRLELAIYQDGAHTYGTITDEEGFFSYTDLDYEGLFTANLRLEQRPQRRPMRVEVEGKDLSGIHYEKNIHTRKFLTTSRGDNWKKVNRPQTFMKRERLFEPSQHTHSIYDDVDQTIYFDDIHDQYNSIFEVLRTRVHGLRIINGEIVLRGPSSIRRSNEPIYLIDDLMVNRSAFLNINLQEVDRLSVISGPKAAILGSRGANGALLIYTKRGDSRGADSYEFSLKGFHRPSETFESNIHTDYYLEKNICRTIFWEPNAQTGNDGKIRLSFPANEQLRNSRLILQGISTDGRITHTDVILE